MLMKTKSKFLKHAHKKLNTQVHSQNVCHMFAHPTLQIS